MFVEKPVIASTVKKEWCLTKINFWGMIAIGVSAVGTAI
jgi:hypothetical protein